MTDLSRKILHTTTEAQRIYRANGLAAQIEALAAGEALPGTTMTKEHAQALAQTMQAVSDFLATEVQPGRTIEDMLYAVWQPAVTSDPPV
jgi:glycogen synthase